MVNSIPLVLVTKNKILDANSFDGIMDKTINLISWSEYTLLITKRNKIFIFFNL